MRSLPCGGPLACLSATTYYTFSSAHVHDGAFWVTSNGGSTWQKRGSLGSMEERQGAFNQGVSSLVCPGDTVCYAGGVQGIAWSTDGARRWHIHNVNSRGAWCTGEIVCLDFGSVACSSELVCYMAGCCARRAGRNNLILTMTDGGRTWRRSLISRNELGFTVGALSCPTALTCHAAGEATVGKNGPVTGRIATTTDGGGHWQLHQITREPYPFRLIVCPSAAVCYALGYLGRLMRSDDGGATWHDLFPAIFVSGTYGVPQAQHIYSPWFDAPHRWHVTIGVYEAAPPACLGLTGVTVSVLNTAGKAVAGPIHTTQWGSGTYTRTLSARGRLRVDVVSPHCSSFTVRIDGVQKR